MRSILLISVIVLFAAGCARHSGQNVYQEGEVGKTTAVSFGTVVGMRSVDIVGKQTGVGALAGAGAGGAIGSQIGSGAGNIGAVAGGILVGAIAGAVAEQALRDRKGTEYTVVLESGIALTVVQEVSESDAPIHPGDRVIVQNSGGYQRVLPAAALPTAINRPRGIQMIDGSKP